MPWIAAVGAVAGAAISSSGSKKAAQTQADAANAAQETQLEMFNRQVELQEPWRQAGIGALGDLTKGTAAGGDFARDFTMADFQADPGYAFRLAQGQKALESSAAARGGLLSGGTGKALLGYGQEAASQEYGNAYNRFNADRDRRFNRLASLAGIGQTATNQVGAFGQNAANNISNLQTQAGNAQAAGTIAQGNAINSAIGTIGNWWQQQPQQTSGQTWYANGSMGGVNNKNSYGTTGLDNFYYGSGTSGD